MDVEIEPSSERLPDNPGLVEWFERADGPAVMAFRLQSEHGLRHEVDWHRHGRGQLISVEAGLLSVRTARGEWSLPTGSAGWMPPDELHTVAIHGAFRGWGLLIAPSAAAALPPHPCVIGVDDLTRHLAERLAGCSLEALLDPRQQRLGAVLLDELRDAPVQAYHLPMPQDRRLLRITAQLLAAPDDPRDLADWARWAGLSPRSLTRHFREETGLSFGQWRQQARLAESLRLLHAGHAVGEVALQLGYSSASAFVTVFSRHYGAPPGRYLQRVRQAGAGAARLASPAASG